MERWLAILVFGLVCLGPLSRVAHADPEHVVDGWVPGAVTDASARALHGLYTGFGAETSGGEGRPVVTVTSLADSGIGSLRSVLDSVARLGGGRVDFAIGGDVVLLAPITVPPNTTIDGLTAPAPGITLWGDRVAENGGSGHVLEIAASNVIVRGLRVRNAVNDGIHVAATAGVSIAGIVVDHCSVTNSGDGGIDVTGDDGDLVRDVTLSWNYLAGNGAPCANKTWCGGGGLVKYGVDRISVHANLWDKNLRRNPAVHGSITDTVDGANGGTLADLRGNVVRGYVESGTQLRDGARGNVVGNFFAGDKPLLTGGAVVFASGNDGASAASAAAPFDVAAPLESIAAAVVLGNAGALPTDPIDAAYRDTLATYADVKNALVAPRTTGGDATIGADTTPPLDSMTLAAARTHLRAARTARTHGHATAAGTEYRTVLDLLDGAYGLYGRSAAATMAAAALGLSQLARDEPALARAHAESALGYARRSGDTGLERRCRRRLRQITG